MTKKPSQTGLVPTQGIGATPVATELQQIHDVVARQGGKLAYNAQTGELKASVVDGDYAYYVEKKRIGTAIVKTMTASPVGNTKDDRKQQVIELKKNYPKASQTTLGEMAGVSQGTVSAYLQEAKSEGLL